MTAAPRYCNHPRLRRILNAFLPDSLLARTAIVLLLAMLVSLGTAVFLFANQRHQALLVLGGRHAVERMSAMVRILEDTPASQRRQVLQKMETPGFRVGWGVRPLVDEVEERDPDSLSVIIREQLSKELQDREIRLCTRSPTASPPPIHDIPPPEPPLTTARPPAPPLSPEEAEPVHPHPHRAAMMRLRDVGMLPGPLLRLSVALDDGTWFNVIAPLDSRDSLWRPRFVGSLALSLLVVFLVALWMVRRATRPFSVFAQAAERLGLDVKAPPLAECGPREVRHAAHAFNVMQERIRRFVDDRTRMLAAISHDLRTPITRLKLRAEFVEDDDERQKMLSDLDEMERMIAATLTFARNDATQEMLRPTDLAAMVQGLVDDMEAMGHRARYTGPDSLVTLVRPLSLKRGLLTNLLDNAIKYGQVADVTLAVDDGHIILTVDDHGPGIPEADFERVFAPFFRLEASRNRDTGGTGLGLAHVRAVARAHGGDVGLENRPQGGLRVRVILPLIPLDTSAQPSD